MLWDYGDLGGETKMKDKKAYITCDVYNIVKIIVIVTIMFFFSQYSYIKNTAGNDEIKANYSECQLNYAAVLEEAESLRDLPLFNMNPTLKQVEAVVREDKVNLVPYDDETFSCVEYSFGLINAFLERKIHACIAWIMFDEYVDSTHSIVAVRTSDYGVIYIEPQSDKIMTSLKVGDDYCDVAYWDCKWKITNIKSCYSDVYPKTTYTETTYTFIPIK